QDQVLRPITACNWKPVKIYRKKVDREWPQNKTRETDSEKRNHGRKVIHGLPLVSACCNPKWHSKYKGDQQTCEGKFHGGRIPGKDFFHNLVRRIDETCAQITRNDPLPVIQILTPERQVQSQLMLELRNLLSGGIVAEGIP